METVALLALSAFTKLFSPPTAELRILMLIFDGKRSNPETDSPRRFSMLANTPEQFLRYYRQFGNAYLPCIALAYFWYESAGHRQYFNDLLVL